MWYIAWVSRLTGHEGRGLAVFTDRAAAEAMCARMNREYPDLSHWVVEQR